MIAPMMPRRPITNKMSAVAAAGAKVLAAIRDLRGIGYGILRFEIAQDGSTEYLGSQFTIRVHPDEDDAAFMARLRTTCKLQPGDTFELVSEGGNITYARVNRQAR